MTLPDFLSYTHIIAAAVTVSTLLALLFLKAFFARHLRKLASDGPLRFLGYIERIIASTRLPFILGVALLAGVNQLDLSPSQDKWARYAWVIVLVSQIALWANQMVTVVVGQAFERHRQKDPAGVTHLMLGGLIARIVVWSLALLVALDNLGFNITTLMASLGIGGIAIALAVQNILGDLFSSVSIALDKPFVIGDFIIVDDYLGTVEYVGLKTTRIRSLGGEQIIISNTELLKNRIRNYKRMQERRVVFEFGVSYDTSAEDLESIPPMIQRIISSSQRGTRFDRAHFKSYSDSSLRFEVVYYVLSPDYNVYMDIQQETNLALLRQFRKQGIAFAHPIRMLQVAPGAGQGTGRASAAASALARIGSDEALAEENL